ncbi:conidiation protein [Stagonosporopsis vannaccii]|nr:conidiation protein [Stagonosporopsis vannaccii]
MSTQQTTADVTAAGLSQVDQNINNTTEDRSHEARGHKANLSNPNTSDTSKEKSAQALKDLGEDNAFYRKQGKGE